MPRRVCQRSSATSAPGSSEAAASALGLSGNRPKQVGPERLQEACFQLYRALRPGSELLIRLDSAPWATPSATTVLACLLRVGFEVTDTAQAADSLDCNLMRPLDLDDIQRFFRNG